MAVVHLSPEMPRLSVRGHKRESSESLFSASYPSPATEDTPDEPGQLQRSYSGRPRSQSGTLASPVLVVNNAKQRKSLRGLGRSRGHSAGWIRSSGKAKQNGTGGGESGSNRRSSATEAENATTQQIDNTFARIKEQLAKLSEEDQVLKERVDKLNEEINILATPVRKLGQTRTALPDCTNISASPSWKTAHFSMSISEGDYPSRSLVPMLLVSSSSQDNLKEQLESGSIRGTATVGDRAQGGTKSLGGELLERDVYQTEHVGRWVESQSNSSAALDSLSSTTHTSLAEHTLSKVPSRVIYKQSKSHPVPPPQNR